MYALITPPHSQESHHFAELHLMQSTMAADNLGERIRSVEVPFVEITQHQAERLAEQACLQGLWVCWCDPQDDSHQLED